MQSIKESIALAKFKVNLRESLIKIRLGRIFLGAYFKFYKYPFLSINKKRNMLNLRISLKMKSIFKRKGSYAK